MPKLEATTDDAPPQFRAEEAHAWVCGYDAGVIEAIAACANVAEESGGLIIAAKIRNLLMNN
jgi:hypothetical protein